MAMVFSKVLDLVPHPSLQAPANSALYDFNDPLTSPSTFTVTQGDPSTPDVSINCASGILTINAAGNGGGGYVIETSHVLPVPNAFIYTKVTQTGTSSGRDLLCPGLYYDANNYLSVFFDNAAQTVRVVANNAGNFTVEAQVRYTLPSAPYVLGVSVTGNTNVTAWIDKLGGVGWEFITGANMSTPFDIRPQNTITEGLKAGLIQSSSNVSQWKISEFYCSRSGPTAMRDPTLVTYPNGTPYIVGGKAYCACTCADVFGGGFTSIFSLDLTSFALVQESVIYSNRSSTSFNDLSAHVIVNGDGTCHLFISTFGSGFGFIKVVHSLVTGDLTSGSWDVATTQLTLPQPATANPGEYDCMAWFDGVLWHMGYVITTDANFGSGVHFYPALATSPDLVTWTAIASDSGVSGSWEGAKIFKGAAGYYILVGGPSGSGNSSRVYDASLNYLGTLDIVFDGGSLTQPHPMLFTNGLKAYTITFDDTEFGSSSFTWGNFIVYEANRYA